MKAIQIDIKGMSPKFAAIVSENQYGFCYMSDKGVAFIKNQSVDGKIYSGSEPCEDIYCYNDSITRYAIKQQVYNTEPTNDITKFMAPKEGEWEWVWVELTIIDIME